MRIVFMGSPQFSADILCELAEHHDVVCVYTQPDRVRSRGKKLVPTPVKEKALSLGIEVKTPQTLKDEKEIEDLASYAPDAICLAAYGVLLPRPVLDIPRYGCLNVHASLLPRWRGAAPIERAILAGDTQAGVCIMRMEEGLDTGDYCVSRAIPIDDMTTEELTSELALLGAQALLTALTHVEEGTVYWTKQDESASTYADKITKGELDIQPSDTVDRALRKVRASSDAHPCRVQIDSRDMRVVQATCHEGVCDGALGTIVVDTGTLGLICKDGCLDITSIKPAGKGLMDIKAFLAGNRTLVNGSSWSAPHGH